VLYTGQRQLEIDIANLKAALQGVADEAAIDAAMRYGVNFPYGPCAWARQIGLSHIVAVLDNLNAQTKDMRYRASLGLRMAAREHA